MRRWQCVSQKKIEELIYQSVKDSKLFDGSWEAMLYSNLLKMIITKGGGVEEFLLHFSPYFDPMDLEYYYSDDLIDRYGSKGYQLFVDMVIGDEK